MVDGWKVGNVVSRHAEMGKGLSLRASRRVLEGAWQAWKSLELLARPSVLETCFEPRVDASSASLFLGRKVGGLGGRMKGAGGVLVREMIREKNDGGAETNSEKSAVAFHWQHRTTLIKTEMEGTKTGWKLERDYLSTCPRDPLGDAQRHHSIHAQQPIRAKMQTAE